MLSNNPDRSLGSINVYVKLTACCLQLLISISLQDNLAGGDVVFRRDPCAGQILGLQGRGDAK